MKPYRIRARCVFTLPLELFWLLGYPVLLDASGVATGHRSPVFQLCLLHNLNSSDKYWPRSLEKMAPVRRYLRISKYSVLECRIYLDSPALVQSWLLHPRHQTLPRVIEAIRPLVLPKLREERERERMKKKPSKKSRVKDVVVKGTFGLCYIIDLFEMQKANDVWYVIDDLEVSMFLTETSTRHSLLSKKKHFREKGPSLMQSNTTKLISETNNQPVDVEEADFAPIRIEEESGDENEIDLSAIPVADDEIRAKRDRRQIGDDGGLEHGDRETAIDVDSGDEEPPSKRRREVMNAESDSDREDDKKKLAMDVTYEGFAIYGRVLCLVVKKRDAGSKTSQSSAAKMENWISSTQIPAEES